MLKITMVFLFLKIVLLVEYMIITFVCKCEEYVFYVVNMNALLAFASYQIFNITVILYNEKVHTWTAIAQDVSLKLRRLKFFMLCSFDSMVLYDLVCKRWNTAN